MTADQAVSTTAGVAMTGATGWLSAAGEVAVQLLGVPLPVVVGATAGALLARGTQEPASFLQAGLRSLLWIVIGCVCAQGAQAILGWALGAALPVGVLGFAALLFSGLGPKLWPVLTDQAPLVLRRWLKTIGGSDATPK